VHPCRQVRRAVGAFDRDEAQPAGQRVRFQRVQGAEQFAPAGSDVNYVERVRMPERRVNLLDQAQQGRAEQC
jgi:hypothetical protein